MNPQTPPNTNYCTLCDMYTDHVAAAHDVAGKTPTPTDAEGELREKLAAIEHERWSDWMQYMLDCAAKSGDDNIGVRVCGWPTAQFENWQRQIETDYEDLSSTDKTSDMEQVDRYWPLIVAWHEADKAKAVLRARLDELQKARRFVEKMAEYADDPEAMELYDDRIAELETALKEMEGMR